jgi:hypothetical protein
VAPNHAETQGARRDMKVCGPWKGSGEGLLGSSRFLSYLVSSSRFLFESYLLMSTPLSPSRLCSDIINLSLPSTPHRGPQTREPAAERLGGLSFQIPSRLHSLHIPSDRIASNLESVWLLGSFHIRSAHPVPQAPQWPAESWEAESGQISSDQITSCFI